MIYTNINKTIGQILNHALSDQAWKDHKLGDTYNMDHNPDKWKIAYYPILQDAKTNHIYDEPRALVEKPITGKLGEIAGIDLREIPLRYLTKTC